MSSHDDQRELDPAAAQRAQEAEDDGKFPKKEEWEALRTQRQTEQNLGPDGTPEDREARFRPAPESAVVQKLREAGDQRGLQEPAHGYEEHKRAASKAQMNKAEKESAGNNRYFNGTKAWIYNPGAPDHGRAIGINRVSEYESVEDELLDAVQGGRGKVKAYECTTRDGRSELMIVSHEHIRPAFSEAEWGKSPIMTPIPDN
jgi:hypothetical protein